MNDAPDSILFYSFGALVLSLAGPSFVLFPSVSPWGPSMSREGVHISEPTCAFVSTRQPGSTFLFSINTILVQDFVANTLDGFYLLFGRRPPKPSSLLIALTAARKATRRPASAREGFVMDSEKTLLFLDD